MSMELKPCPFCGNTASFDRVGNRQQSTIVSCDDCGCSLENGEEWNHGRGWNERPQEDVLAARIAEQDAKIAELEAVIRDNWNGRGWGMVNSDMQLRVNALISPQEGTAVKDDDNDFKRHDDGIPSFMRDDDWFEDSDMGARG